MKMVKDKDGVKNKGLLVSINKKVLRLCKIIIEKKNHISFCHHNLPYWIYCVPY